MTTAREELARLLFTTDNSGAVDPAHEWEMLSHQAVKHVQYVYDMADALIAAGYVKAPPGTPTRDDVLEEAANALENARQYGGACGQQLRRPSNYASAAHHVRTLKTGTP
jgi:hypothetical protein